MGKGIEIQVNEQIMDELASMIETLCNGIEWMIENHPTIMNEADNEALAEAKDLIAKVRGSSERDR